MATGTQLEKRPPAVPGQIQWADRIAAIVARGRSQWAGMAAGQKRGALTAAALLAALIGSLLWFGLRTDWRTLYADLDPEDARQIEQTLNQAQIPFDTTASGSGIRVPSDQLDKARLATAAKGGVKSGRMGFELFDQPNWVGSEFDEQVNYQRALEGELEHTVSSLADVDAARVHLVLPHDSLFRDQERAAKASVVLKLRHRSIAEGEPEAIRNLVASAVDGLVPERVVLVDAAGHTPLGSKTPDQVRLSAEQALEEKLVATLEPVTGAGNVRASVTLDYDPAASDETQETYDPDQTVALSMQRTEQTTGPQPVAAGVPGTASNAPNTQALPVYPRETTPPQTAKTESGTYGASKTVRHVVEGPGKIRRLTAAIVVNDRLAERAGKGKTAVWQPRSAEELRELTALAQAAVGFDAARGDMLAVQDLAFDENHAEPEPSISERVLTKAEGSPALIKAVALLLGLLAILSLGVRPALGRAASAPALPSRVPPAELPGGHEAHGGAPVLKPAEPAELDPGRIRAQEVLEQVSEHLKREPTQSSRLLQSWIHID